ncbi:MAG: tetraacyldisaccharide 4'-kinase, partial [Calditrichaeota bacterium]|nr:tetraacyldisaccharide 4'-kinase [Calditrichota bacterium]
MRCPASQSGAVARLPTVPALHVKHSLQNCSSQLYFGAKFWCVSWAVSLLWKLVKMMLLLLNALKWLLLPLGMLHWAAVWLRNRCYDWGICRSRRLAVPVISIGNIQMGG